MTKAQPSKMRRQNALLDFKNYCTYTNSTLYFSSLIYLQLINQQNSIQQTTRIITPQGTIVTHNQANHQMPQSQNNAPQSQNGPMPQQTALQQRASPHPQQVQQAKKVIIKHSTVTQISLA